MEGKNGRNYALGRGELWFNRFAPGTQVGSGERYFGNTPEFTTTSDSEELEHFDSDHGINEKDDSVTLSNTTSGSFTTDNIIADNIALFFLGSASALTQLSAVGRTETITVRRGLAYQLGVTDVNPQGVRGITNVVMTKGVAPGTPVALLNNAEADLDLGRVYIELDSTDIPDDTAVTFTYDIVAGTQTKIISGTTEIEGSLRFISFNPKGQPIDHFWPRVKISPNGDFALKSGDDWQTLPFNVEFLKLGNKAKVYSTTRLITAQ